MKDIIVLIMAMALVYTVLYLAIAVNFIANFIISLIKSQPQQAQNPNHCTCCVEQNAAHAECARENDNAIQQNKC